MMRLYTRWSKKFKNSFSGLDTILSCDRRTDIQTDRQTLHDGKCMPRYAERRAGNIMLFYTYATER